MYNVADLIPPAQAWNQLGIAAGINDAGQIVGTGSIGGFVHAYLLTPVSSVQQIIDMVSALGAQGTLNQGQANSLIAKLQAAGKQIDKGNSTPAINEFEAFIHELNALIGHQITTAQGQPLIAAAEGVIQGLRN